MDFREGGVAEHGVGCGSCRKLSVIVSYVVAFPVDREAAGMGAQGFTGRSVNCAKKEIE